MNINLNQQTLEMCLKEINNIGSTTYQNICTGQSTVVPWGTTDWIGGIGNLVAGLLLFCLLALVFITITYLVVNPEKI